MVDRSSYVPMYQQVKADIEAQILDGRIKIGDKLMSEAEMIRHYGVGRVTVRNALAELVASGCLRKEQGLGTFCAALPRREAAKKIDVLLNTADRSFTPYFLSGIDRALEGKNCDMILHDTRDDMENITRLLAQALERGTNGVILQPCTQVAQIPEECVRLIGVYAQQDIPLVTMDGSLPLENIPCVLNDDTRGCYMATQYLAAMGHRRILGLFRNRYRDSAARAEGYRQALREEGLLEYILDADATSPEQWLAYIQKEEITAVVCYNDYLAVKCYHCFDSHGIRVGEQISVVGFDDTEVARSALPGMTTVTHPKDRMGEKAAQYVLTPPKDRQEPDLYVFQPELICRNSVRKYTGI